MKIAKGREQDYKVGYDKNSDPYGRECYLYAERWAERLEKLIDAGGSPADVIEQHAKRLSSEADTSGITGFMYGASVSILANCWEHGELLRRWHNLDIQIGTEGEKANAEGSTLNPALLNIG